MNSLEVTFAILAFCLVLMLIILFVSVLRANIKLNVKDMLKPNDSFSNKTIPSKSFNGYVAVIPACRQMYGSNDLSAHQYQFTKNEDIERAFKSSLESDGREFRI